MKTLIVVGGVMFASAVASAEPVDLWLAQPRPHFESGMFLDFGFGAERVAPGTGDLYSANFVRFAPQAMITRHFYLGAEVDIGSITGVKIQNAGSAPRTTDGSGTDPMALVADGGTVAAGKALFGARATAGIFSGAVELAPTLRMITLSHDNTASSQAFDQLAVEAHGKLDLWLSPMITVGAFVGVDLGTTDNIQAALQVGLHFEGIRTY